MASLVDSRPSPSSIPLPQSQSQSPLIKTTTNTLHPAPQFQLHADDSTPSPHLEIPGSFPHDRKNTSEASRGQASQLLGARRTSLPSTEREGVKPGEHYDGVGPLPGTISETSVAKLPDERMQLTREADKPSQSHTGEHHDGVGPLPGSNNETSVAKLPDERMQSAREVDKPTQRHAGEHHDGVGPLPGSNSETSVAKLPDDRMQPTREADKPTQRHAAGAGIISLPSSLGERKGVQPYEHHDGAGPLPGTSSETSVAKLPDERAAATAPQWRPGAAAAGTGLQKPANNTVTPAENRAPAPHAEQRILSPETGDQNVISQQSPPAQQVLERADRGPDVGKHPADSKSKEEGAVKEKKSELEKEGERKGEEHHEPQRATEKDGTPKQQQERKKSIPTSEPGPPSPTQRKGRSGRSNSDSDASHHKKASVMNMVKGEMKVLLGKASRNKGKVEEGEKLKKQGSN